MQKPFLSDKPEWLALLWLLMITFCSLGISSFLSLVVVKLLYGVDVLDIAAFLSDLDNPVLMPALKVMQTFQAIGGFILPPLFFAQLYTGNALEVDGAFGKPKVLELVVAMALIILAQPIINFTAEWNSGINFPDWGGIEQWMKESEESTAKLTERFLNMPTLGSMLFNVFMIGLLPALGEEFLFRGTLQPIFKRMFGNIHIAIFLAAFIFSAMHMQFYGFIPRLLLGIVLGYFAAWSGSIWVSVAAHFFNNAAAVLLSYLVSNQFLGKEAKTIGAGGDWKLVIMSVLICAFLLKQLHTYRSKWAD